MACYRPLQAWQLEDSSICFKEPKQGLLRELELPCGRCIGCRISAQREWAIRCLHEAQMHEVNTFATLTYEGKVSPSLNYPDFQRFMYRVRAKHGPTRFFMCGEYGELNQRPHFHALLFGRWLDSVELERLWGHGYCTAGQVNYQSASYVARYATKKISGPPAAAHYARVDTSTGEILAAKPEFARMSLRPGIGATWWHRFWKETSIPRDGIVIPGGFKLPTPRYYDKLLQKHHSQIKENLDYQRYLNRQTFLAHTTSKRLKDRENYALAQLKHRTRNKL